MIKNYKRSRAYRQTGFTLIELLVVIAIIGILAAIILASVAGARSKGASAAIQEDLHNIQTQAEIAASDNSNSYPTTLFTGGGAGAVGTDETPIVNGIANIKSLNGNIAPYDPTPTNTTYVISATLPSGGAWCVDSTGNAKSETAQLTTGTAC